MYVCNVIYLCNLVIKKIGSTILFGLTKFIISSLRSSCAFGLCKAGKVKNLTRNNNNNKNTISDPNVRAKAVYPKHCRQDSVIKS